MQEKLEIEKYLCLERVQKLIKDREEIINEYVNNKPCESSFKNECSIKSRLFLYDLEKSYIELEKSFVNTILE